MDKKEVEDFLIRFGGAMTGAIEDSAFECYYKAFVDPARPFPFLDLNPNLPPLDDLIVGGLSIPPWVIGTFMEDDGKNRGDMKEQEAGKQIRKFGEGNVCYSVPLLIYTTLIRATKSSIPGSSIPPATRQPAPAISGQVIKF